MTWKPPENPPLENPFWQYSLAFWEHKAAQKALLHLQDDYDQGVNLLLFSIWISVVKQASMTKIIDKAYELSQHWQNDVVIKVRSARKTLTKSAPLRDTLMNVEMEAERIEQAMLFQLMESTRLGPCDQDELSRLLDNLCQCIEKSGRDFCKVPPTCVIPIVQSAYPELSLEVIQAQLASRCST